MHALWISSGIVVWALHFTALYGLTALACARGQGAAVPWIVIVATAIAVTVATGIFVKGYRGRAAFVEWMTMGVAASALIGIAYEAAAGLLSPLCE
ncbi:MAG TPA: hypothetical protein VFZ04_22290, partial [Longimicrobiales bacterium]